MHLSHVDRQDSFTLIENVLVFAIIAIAAVIVIPKFINLSEKKQFEDQARALQTHLYSLREQAIARGEKMCFDFYSAHPGADSLDRLVTTVTMGPLTSDTKIIKEKTFTLNPGYKFSVMSYFLLGCFDRNGVFSRRYGGVHTFEYHEYIIIRITSEEKPLKGYRAQLRVTTEAITYKLNYGSN